jgi:sigma-B regulation protein RsbU (phosphoserine phosphatase)
MNPSGIAEGLSPGAASEEAFEKEMESLANLQLRLLPRHLPRPAGWQIAAYSAAGSCPGGNYYDVFLLPEGRVGLFVADASGRGGTAVVMVAQVRLTLHSCPLSSGTGRLPFCPVDGRMIQPPQLVLDHLHDILRENALEGECMTAFYGLLGPSGTLDYANACHPLARLWQAGTGCVGPVPDVTGPPLGVGSRGGVDLQCRLTLEPGDLLVCFTNGLTEARNAQGQAFGLERLDDAIRKGAVGGAEEVKRRVLASLDEFLADEEPQDDLTILVVERRL